MKDPAALEKATWKVVSPPPPLAAAKIDALLATWRGTKHVVAVDPLDGGIMNWNYAVRLSGSAERCVLRFYDRAPASCAKEVRILALVHGDVPVPEVLYADVNGADGYPPFCVLEFIDGMSLRELRRRGDAKGVGEASYDAGRLLPRLGRHRFPRSGLLSPALQVQDGPFADASLGEVVEHFMASPLFRQRIDATLIMRIRDFVAVVARTELRSASRHADAGLVHADFNSPNIFVRQDRGTWRVAAILDWEFACAGSILCDIGNMLRYERPGQPRYEPHFSRGLADGGWDAPDDWFLRARLADLPALCELLTRDDVPEAVVEELRDLIVMTTNAG
ncbi:MAG TPA: aminoglycoside phosphotransferase family protein [Vicinamibacterales bacterium]|nr:aminoglycoside phosphotransferase family protein [Vicinamibacterales bacterium]